MSKNLIKKKETNNRIYYKVVKALDSCINKRFIYFVLHYKIRTIFLYKGTKW